MLSFNSKNCIVRGLVANDLGGSPGWLAVQRGDNNAPIYKVGGDICKSSSDLAKCLPVQSIDIGSPGSSNAVGTKGGDVYLRAKNHIQIKNQ